MIPSTLSITTPVHNFNNNLTVAENITNDINIVLNNALYKEVNMGYIEAYQKLYNMLQFYYSKSKISNIDVLNESEYSRFRFQIRNNLFEIVLILDSTYLNCHFNEVI